MRYKLSVLGLVVVAGVLSLLLVLRHLDTNQATTAQPLQSFDSDAQGEIRGSIGESVPKLPGALAQAPQDNVAADDTASSCDGNAPGMADPAAVYCQKLGYAYETVDASGGQHGVCVLPDGGRCDAWGFLEGKCGKGYSYCARQGYDVTTKTDGKDPLSQRVQCLRSGPEGDWSCDGTDALERRGYQRGFLRRAGRTFSSRRAFSGIRDGGCTVLVRLEELQRTGLDDFCQGPGKLRLLLGVLSRWHSGGRIQHQYKQPQP